MKDRRKRWVKQHLREGKCSKCSEKRVRGSARYCAKHLEDDRERKRAKLDVKPWRPGGKGRPPISARNAPPTASPSSPAHSAHITIPLDVFDGDSISPTRPKGVSNIG